MPEKENAEHLIKPISYYETENDKEINKKAEKRRKSLQSLLEENQNVLSTLTDKKSRLFSTLSCSSSNSSLKQVPEVVSDVFDEPELKEGINSKTEKHEQSKPNNILDQEKAYRASGAIPKKPLPAIIEPSAENIALKSKKKVGKAKSVSSVIPNTVDLGM